jgi:hypothetical protein
MKVCRIHEGDAPLRTEVQTDGGEWQPGRSPSSTTPDAAHGSTATVAVSAGAPRPGELFSIGALSAGSGMEIGRWLEHGDTLELDLAGVGHITHQIK